VGGGDAGTRHTTFAISSPSAEALSRAVLDRPRGAWDPRLRRRATTNGGATAAGTVGYARRFPESAARGHFREALGLHLSSLGLGTYLGREDAAGDQAYRDAIGAAVAGGINVLDTAVNYRGERSERALGAALADLTASGFPRDGVVVATKGGYVPARDAEAYFTEHIVRQGRARADDLVAGCHCLAPGYLRHQLDRSLENLGLGSVDIYYLHNPEQQLDEVEPTSFGERIRAAFEMLEEEVGRGRVGHYGTATWNGYRRPPGPRALSLEALVARAREVAGESHHFRVVQLPFSLGMPEALRARTQVVAGRPCTLLEAAGELGTTVIGSASLLQGQLAQGLPAGLLAAPGLSTDAQRALQIARSAPGLTTALVGMARLAHVRENLAVLAVPPLAPEAVAGLLRSR
jgi:aryl-alcohol dehydrogenase-like predicted oxidoreductase